MWKRRLCTSSFFLITSTKHNMKHSHFCIFAFCCCFLQPTINLCWRRSTQQNATMGLLRLRTEIIGRSRIEEHDRVFSCLVKDQNLKGYFKQWTLEKIVGVVAVDVSERIFYSSFQTFWLSLLRFLGQNKNKLEFILLECNFLYYSPSPSTQFVTHLAYLHPKYPHPILVDAMPSIRVFSCLVRFYNTH
jgi:hypothetical protein